MTTTATGTLNNTRTAAVRDLTDEQLADPDQLLLDAPGIRWVR